MTGCILSDSVQCRLALKFKKCCLSAMELNGEIYLRPTVYEVSTCTGKVSFYGEWHKRTESASLCIFWGHFMDVGTYLAPDKADLGVFVGMDLYFGTQLHFSIYSIRWSCKNGCVELQRNENCACISNKIVTDAEYYFQHTISSAGWCYSNVIRASSGPKSKIWRRQELELEEGRTREGL